mmetsp:Transcript_3920/g.5782  ORF Transcript_3920/g.5782 Transcript_3920/m.5782 type:complete len:215 (-) Transcript_3920:490-1134(-)
MKEELLKRIIFLASIRVRGTEENFFISNIAISTDLASIDFKALLSLSIIEKLLDSSTFPMFFCLKAFSVFCILSSAFSKMLALSAPWHFRASERRPNRLAMRFLLRFSTFLCFCLLMNSSVLLNCFFFLLLPVGVVLVEKCRASAPVPFIIPVLKSVNDAGAERIDENISSGNVVIDSCCFVPPPMLAMGISPLPPIGLAKGAPAGIGTGKKAV